jgi:hypothetical protein
LKKVFNDDEFRALSDLMREVVREETKDFVRKEDIKHLLTKEEFYSETAKIYKKLNDIEEERDLLSYRVSRHSDQISRIEKHLALPELD